MTEDHDAKLAARVEHLSERQEVVDVVTRLFLATDARDWTGVEACFEDEVLFDMSSMGAGPAARVPARSIVEGWEAGLRSIREVHHQTGNHLVRIDVNRATAFCYGVAFHHLPNRSGRNTRIFVGSYDFELQKREGEWRIAAFRFRLKFRDGDLDLESSAESTR